MENIKTDIDVKNVSFVVNNRVNAVDSVITGVNSSFSRTGNNVVEELILTGANSSCIQVLKYPENSKLPYLKVPLASFLAQNGSSIDEVNNIIKSDVISAGVCTREGTVKAILSLISILSNYGVKLPYISSIGNLTYGKYLDYGVDPEWATSGHWYSGKYDYDYYYTGLDCSGLISWALHNSGYKYEIKNADSFSEMGIKRSIDSSGKAGDLLWHEGHIAMIVGVTDDYYIVAQEVGDPDGLVITHTDFSGIDNVSKKPFTHIIDISEYYNDSSNFDLDYFE